MRAVIRIVIVDDHPVVRDGLRGLFADDQRVHEAQRLLRAGRLPLLSVTLGCGFASQSHMTRLFRRYLGVTPGAYQRLLSVPPPPEAPVALSMGATLDRLPGV